MDERGIVESVTPSADKRDGWLERSRAWARLVSDQKAACLVHEGVFVVMQNRPTRTECPLHSPDVVHLIVYHRVWTGAHWSMRELVVGTVEEVVETVCLDRMSHSIWRKRGLRLRHAQRRQSSRNWRQAQVGADVAHVDAATLSELDTDRRASHADVSPLKRGQPSFLNRIKPLTRYRRAVTAACGFLNLA